MLMYFDHLFIHPLERIFFIIEIEYYRLMNAKNRAILKNSPSLNHRIIIQKLNKPSFMQPSNTLQQQTSSRQRKSSPIPLFIINLLMPLLLTGLNVTIFLSIQNRSILFSYLLIAICFFGFVFSLWQILLIANWRDIVRLYFALDSLIPVLIAGFLGLYTLLNFMKSGNWYQYCFYIGFPLWLFYFAGYLRVVIAFGDWRKWQIVSYKLVVVLCGLGFFYIGIYYMNGAYKVTNGIMPELEQKLKNIVLLYVFATNELFFQYYRRISEFDQTEELQYSYEFRSDKEGKMAINTIDFEQELIKAEPRNRICQVQQKVKKLQKL